MHRKLLCGALAGPCGRDALFDHRTDNAFARLDLTIFDISFRCVAEEDASDGDERAWLQV